MVLVDNELDWSMREADVAIRMSPPRQPDLVQRHLMTVRHHAYASADYLKKYGTPQRAEELDKHRIIVYGTDSRPPIRNPNWLLEAGARPGYERHPILAVNNLYAILRALEGGLGIASRPDDPGTDFRLIGAQIKYGVVQFALQFQRVPVSAARFNTLWRGLDGRDGRIDSEGSHALVAVHQNINQTVVVADIVNGHFQRC